MSAGAIPDRVAARALDQPSGPISVAYLVTLLTSMTNVLGRGTTATASNVTRRALGLAHVVTCRLNGSTAPLAVNPATNGALRVGYDIPHDPRPATARRSPDWAACNGTT